MRYLYKKIRFLVFSLCLFSAGVFFADSLWIQAKAQLAQHLIKDAWHKTLESGESVKPWNWADTWPVARLQSAVHDADLYVLQGAKGNSLAFGPGVMLGSATVNGEGTTVIAGHRDTHFKFMQQLKINDELRLTDATGVIKQYQVKDLQVIDSGIEQLILETKQQLLLVTCYPFDSVDVGGPLRYVAKAISI